MYLAPLPTFTATPAPAPSGNAGVFHTVALMRRYIDAGKISAPIIQAATSLVYLTPERDEQSEVIAIFNFVRDSIRYQRDVCGVETLCTPEMTLQRGVGDCDDKTALLCALLESVGYPTRLVMAAYTEPGKYEHVYCDVFLCGDWVSADPTERKPLGYSPPGAMTIWNEPI